MVNPVCDEYTCSKDTELPQNVIGWFEPAALTISIRLVDVGFVPILNQFLHNGEVKAVCVVNCKVKWGVAHGIPVVDIRTVTEQLGDAGCQAMTNCLMQRSVRWQNKIKY